MTEREDQAQPTTEASITHLEPGPAVEFALLPGQRFELSVSADGVLSLRITDSEPLPTPPAPPSAEPTPAAAPEPQQRVNVAGRVGTATTFRTTPKGVKIARFSVAEHPDTDSTTWRTILAFGKRAEGLQQKPLEKGQAIEVVGYPHQREVTTNGVKQTVEEIYATAIKRR